MIAIKPHHFVDIITSFGEENVAFEPHPYGHAVHVVARQILDDHDVVLFLELGCDDICQPCSHHVDGRCDDTIDTSFRPQAPASKQAYNQLIDQRWCERLGLEPGSQLTARAFCELIRDRAGDLESIYRETPAERTRRRQAKLIDGVTRFLRGTV